MKRIAWLVVALGACGHQKRDGADPPPKVAAPAPADGGAPAPDPCTPEALKLAGATLLPGWTPPGGCMLKGDQNVLMRSAADVAAHLDCPAGTNLGVDFTRQAIAVSPTVLYATTQGFTGYDDGKVITIVVIARTLCPGEPGATPRLAPSWFLVPAGEGRTFVETSCVHLCT